MIISATENPEVKLALNAKWNSSMALIIQNDVVVFLSERNVLFRLPLHYQLRKQLTASRTLAKTLAWVISLCLHTRSRRLPVA